MVEAAHPARIVIVGASLAGASAAVTLRELGYAGELTLIGEETELPYERPPLSKAVLIGRRGRAGLGPRRGLLRRPADRAAAGHDGHPDRPGRHVVVAGRH